MDNRTPTEHILQFFAYEHLPPHLQEISCRFAIAAAKVQLPDCGKAAVQLLHRTLVGTEPGWSPLPDNPEKDMCLKKMHLALNPGLDLAAQYCEHAERELVLRALLEAKDCAVRAMVAK